MNRIEWIVTGRFTGEIFRVWFIENSHGLWRLWRSTASKDPVGRQENRHLVYLTVSGRIYSVRFSPWRHCFVPTSKTFLLAGENLPSFNLTLFRLHSLLFRFQMSVSLHLRVLSAVHEDRASTEKSLCKVIVNGFLLRFVKIILVSRERNFSSVSL